MCHAGKRVGRKKTEEWGGGGVIPLKKPTHVLWGSQGIVEEGEKALSLRVLRQLELKRQSQ